MAKRKKYTAVAVEWIDSAAPARPWLEQDDARAFDPVVIVSVGFLLRKTKTKVLLMQSLVKNDAHGQLGGINAIPRAAVVSITPLYERTKKGK